MKLFYKFLIFFLIFSLNSFGQNSYLKICGQNPQENKTIDSVGYISKFKEQKMVLDEIENFRKKIIQNGFFESKIQKSKKENDSVYEVTFNLQKRIDSLHINLALNEGIRKIIFDSKKESIVLPIQSVENFLNLAIQKLEKNGYALAKLQLINFRKENSKLIADLVVNSDQTRKLDDLVIKEIQNFPIGFKTNLTRKYKNKKFNQKQVEKIKSDFDKIRFVKQIKYPEILFTKDSTKVFVYLDKKSANTFDGFLGFGNDDQNKLRINGYLDLNFTNLLNSGEEFSFNWKSDGNDQKTFNANLELPFVFNTPIGIKGQLQIFKQDSTFQTTKTAIDLGYYFKTNSKVFLGYQTSQSINTQTNSFSFVQDYNNTFITSNYDFYTLTDSNRYGANLFLEKTKIYLKIGLGNRTVLSENTNQIFGELIFNNNFYLNNRNSIYIRNENFYLKSKQYIINELYRFGGINSIRGFNENSLQSNFVSSIQSEYRYLLSQNIYLHTVADFGYYKDESINSDGTLSGLGFGMGLLTKNGLFKLLIANGNSSSQNVKLSNSIVHISLVTKF